MLKGDLHRQDLVDGVEDRNVERESLATFHRIGQQDVCEKVLCHQKFGLVRYAEAGLEVGANGVGDPSGDGVRCLQIQTGLAVLVEIDQVKEPCLGEVIPQLDGRFFDR